MRSLLLATTVLVACVSAPTSAQAAPAWVPSPDDQWQYQLTTAGPASTGGVRIAPCAVPYSGGECVTPDVYDIDLYGPDGVTPNTVAVDAIHAAGAHAVCYVSAGSWEDWRPDADAYPASVLGADMEDWDGEKWVDVRATTVLLPIVEARVEACAEAGFDAVEFDNVDGYTNETGFPLTANDQLVFNRAIADLAHGHGLSVGLKNDLDQVPDLVADFDFAVNEQCQENTECAALTPFLRAGKAVFQVEYTDEGSTTAGFCPQANAAGRSAILKSYDLDPTPWTPCR